MSSIDELIHILDKEQAVLKAETSAILSDHTEEISLLRREMKELTAFVSEKFSIIWLKIFGIIGGTVGAAVIINQLLG